jgi:calcineurin-like phosphoesterase family protein
MPLRKLRSKATLIMELNSNKLFVISDTHFCHTNIIKYCNRPFENADIMNKVLIDNWNKTVNKDDVILHLGDITAGAGKQKDQRTREILARLNGKKLFIRGNHDSGIKCVQMLDAVSFSWYGIRIHCTHVPDYRFQPFGDFHLHGHIHQNTIKLEDSFNCSVENINYTPVRLSEIIEKHYDSKINSRGSDTVRELCEAGLGS